MKKNLKENVSIPAICCELPAISNKENEMKDEWDIVLPGNWLCNYTQTPTIGDHCTVSTTFY